MINRVDVLVDVQRGDCGKGKISKCITQEYHYDVVAKFNGGGNAGHAVWVDGKKFTAHYLTSGIYFPSTDIVIGPGCVINAEEFLKEYNEFTKSFNLVGRVFVHPYAHIIQERHLLADDSNNKIGTTKKGIGPAYADKYARTGLRAEDCDELKEFLLPNLNFLDGKSVLMEGSQGWGLDIDWGNYPYVTSSHIHPAFAFATFGIPMTGEGIIFGACKPYETYVGSSEDEVYATKEDSDRIREAGSEYGETTGRPRKIGYLELDTLVDAVNRTGVEYLVMNKCDVLEEVKIFKLFPTNKNESIVELDSLEHMQRMISAKLYSECPNLEQVIFSGDKYGNDIMEELP